MEPIPRFVFGLVLIPRLNSKESKSSSTDILQQELSNLPNRLGQHPSPILVKKPTGAWRICVDYRALNNITTKDAHPFPRIDDSYMQLQGARFFTSLDLQNGYWQIPLDKDSMTTMKKTASTSSASSLDPRKNKLTHSMFKQLEEQTIFTYSRKTHKSKPWQ